MDCVLAKCCTQFNRAGRRTHCHNCHNVSQCHDCLAFNVFCFCRRLWHWHSLCVSLPWRLAPKWWKLALQRCRDQRCQVSPSSGEFVYQASLISGMGFTSTWIAGVTASAASAPSWSDAEKWTDMNWYFLGYLDLLSYLILLFLFFSLLVTMCRTLPQSVSCEVCLPILVELAPSSRKSGIMAWQVALEGVSSIVVASIIGVSWPESQEANELVESLWRCMKKVSGHLFYAPPYVQSWSKRYILTAH